MVQKFAAITVLLVSFLGFSLVLSSLAVPSTRSLESREEQHPSSVHDSHIQDALMEMRSGDREEVVEFINGRMDLESTDYPGTGANNRHDPKTPGTA